MKAKQTVATFTSRKKPMLKDTTMLQLYFVQLLKAKQDMRMVTLNFLKKLETPQLVSQSVQPLLT